MTDLNINVEAANNGSGRRLDSTLTPPQRALAADGNAPNPLAMQERVTADELSKRSYLEQAIHFTTANKQRQIVVAVSLGVFLVLYLVFVICLGVYGYGGPDMKHAWYVDGVDTPALTKAGATTIAQERNIPIKEGYPVDMGNLFRTWFLWGFWGSIMQILIFCVFAPIFILVRSELRVKTIVFASVQGVQCLSTVLWFFFGFFWRFCAGGRVVSGESLERAAGDTDDEWNGQLDAAQKADGYQFSSGTFMAVYLWIIITLLIVAAVTMGCYGGKQYMEEQERKHQEEMPEEALERERLREQRQQQSNIEYQEVPLQGQQ